MSDIQVIVPRSDVDVEVIEKPSLVVEVLRGAPGIDGMDGSITSVNGNVGPAVVLTTDNISEGAVNKYFTDARAQTAVISAAITNGVTNKAPSSDAVFDALALKQDSLSFAPVPDTRTITAGTGLSGGGDLTTNRTLDLANTSVTPGAYTNTNLTVDAQGRITSASSGSSGGVTSFNTRTGAVVPQAGDYTKSDVGLGNVDNTSDLNKPISTATQTALNLKQDSLGFTPENVANKATDLTSPDNTKYPTTLAVSSAIGAIPPVNDATTSTKGIVKLAGDLDGTAALPTIGLNKVTNAKAAQMAANTIKGNNTGAIADPSDLTTTQATAMLNDFVGENGVSAGTKGLVPAPAVLDGLAKRKFIRADGSWSSQTKEISNRGEALTAISGFVQRNTTANQWFGLTECPEFGTVIAISSSGTNRVLRSLDGRNWHNLAIPEANLWTKICYSPELRRAVAVAYSGTNRGMYSDDGGATWTVCSPGAYTWYDICWSPKVRRYVAVNHTGGTGGAYSSDGITWTNITFPGGATTNFYTVCWSDDLEKFVAVRLNGGSYSSADGITWVASVSIGDKSWSSVCYGKGVGRFVAVGISGAGTSRISYSEDGETWVTGSIPAAAWRRVVYSEDMGMYLAVASGGQLAYSFDGATFTSGTAPEATNQWYDVIWSKYVGAFIIASITGTSRIMTSRMLRNFIVNQKNSFVINGSTTAFTLSLLHANVTWRKTDSTNITITVPENASVPFVIGTKIKFVNAGTAIMTFAIAGAAVIQSRGGFLTVSTQHGVAELEKVDVNTWVLSGDIS